MAKATYVKPKPVRPPRGKVILELTEGEADLILCVMGWIGGSPNSPRKYADRIITALETTLDLPYELTDAQPLAYVSKKGQGLYFNDYPLRESVPVNRQIEEAASRYERCE